MLLFLKYFHQMSSPVVLARETTVTENYQFHNS